MAANHFMSVNDVAKETGISPGLLYDWASKEKVPKKMEDGVMQISLDAVKAHREKMLPRKKTIKAAPTKRRPATKQADRIGQMAAALEVFFPQGIPPNQYANAILFVKALETVAP